MDSDALEQRIRHLIGRMEKVQDAVRDHGTEAEKAGNSSAAAWLWDGIYETNLVVLRSLLTDQELDLPIPGFLPDDVGAARPAD